MVNSETHENTVAHSVHYLYNYSIRGDCIKDKIPFS